MQSTCNPYPEIMLNRVIYAYLGCDCMIVESNSLESPPRGTLFVFDEEIAKEKTIKIKLELRKFEDITQEEKTTAMKLCGFNMLTWNINQWNGWGGKAVCFDSPLSAITFSVKGINYLRSIGIDCDNLIESGNAIRKKS